MKKLNLENADHQIVDTYNEIISQPRHRYWWTSDERLFNTFFPTIGQHRDSGDLQESNFAAAIKMLEDAGCEEEEDYTICRSSCSMVGWQEGIYVHKESHAAMVMAEVAIALEGYPVLDGDDYSERQMNSRFQQWDENGYDEFIEWVAEHYEVDEDEEVVIDGVAYILSDVLPKDTIRGEYDSCEGWETTFDYEQTLDAIEPPLGNYQASYEGLWAKLQIWLKGAGADEDMLDQDQD